MSLPLEPPLAPQLARSRAALPDGEGWSYEPKWDGFRAIAFVDDDGDGDTAEGVVLLSRGGKPLERYFPELRFPPGRYVLDGEIVIDRPDETGTDGLPANQDFDALSQRIHPAASRIAKLSQEIPARFVAFDLLADGDESLLERPFSARRAALEARLADPAFSGSSVTLTPTVATAPEAAGWLTAIEGVVAKELDAPYRPGERKGMAKIKRKRTIDCVVVGWRPGKEERTVGSLILGLYDPAGELQTVGHTSSFTAKRKRELYDELAAYASGETGSAEPSRWRSDKELEWTALRPELVVEVSFDQVSDRRIRHGAKLERWRDDKPPAACLIEQLDS
jgi:ATP-dependent DNA ligase